MYRGGESISINKASVESSSRFMSQVYALMSGGLALTGLVAYLVASNPEMLKAIAYNRGYQIGLFILQIGIVIALTAFIEKMSAATATAGFIAYSVVVGVFISVIFAIYTTTSIASVFFITAGAFAGLSAFGYFTKKDLTGVGNFCIMGLWGLIIATIVNLFLQSPGLYYFMSYIGILIFAGLTAYDTQKIKQISMQGFDGETGRKYAVIGALELYLDFINMFLFLLRLFGDRR